MDPVVWDTRPELSEPVLVAAFEGWNDAGEAASTAASYLGRRWRLRSVASIDAEDFYDFSTTRPRVRLDDKGIRTIDWPSNVFRAGSTDTGRDVVVLVGTEPQLRWRTFCDAILSVADDLEVSMVVTLGALISDVHHARPVPIVGTAADPALGERLGLRPSSYEGPTGIVGVLTDACRQAGYAAASLWASVPSYVPNAMSPKAALALVERVADLLGTAVATDDLAVAAESYERQVTRMVSSDDELSEYVAGIEARSQEVDEPAGEEFIAEVERFLREQKDD